MSLFKTAPKKNERILAGSSGGGCAYFVIYHQKLDTFTQPKKSGSVSKYTHIFRNFDRPFLPIAGRIKAKIIMKKEKRKLRNLAEQIE